MTKGILAAMLSCSSIALSDEEKYLFAKYNPLGVSLFSRNIQSVEQTKKLIDDIKNVINREDVLIAIDEEGGRVSRLKSIQKTQYASAEILGKLPIEYSYMHAQLISADMRKLGMNVNYAPVVDKKLDIQTKALETRCFSEDENKIVKYAKTMADCYIESGICPCIKHIPGHFETIEDPHLAAPKTNISYEEIKKETAYLRQFSHYPLVMTAHITLSAIDENIPVTMSPKAVDKLLRKELDMNGFIISDAIDMHALTGTLSEKMNNCLDAGLDSVCYCFGKIEEMQEICDTNRFMTEKSLLRFAKIKNIVHNTSKQINVEKIREQYLAGIRSQLDTKYSYDATEILNQMSKMGG